MVSIGSSSVGVRAVAGCPLANRVPTGKASERKGCGNGMWLVVGDDVRKGPAGRWGRLETAIAPACVEIETPDGSSSEHRTAVHRHVHCAGPLPHDPQPADPREKRDSVRKILLQDAKIPPLRK